MTILVTGGAGFIGSNFVRLWRSLSVEPIVNLDLLTYAGNLSNLANLDGDHSHFFVHGDIGDRQLVDSILTQYTPRAVINFAAESHVDRSIHDPKKFIVTNVLGTFNLLEATRNYWQNSSSENNAFRFLHVSTDEVYGTLLTTDPPFSETSNYQPSSPYSASKAASDHIVRAWHHTYGLPTITTNCSNNYGPYQFPEKLIPLILLNALSNKPLPIYGDGQQIRDWLYVEDHCFAIIRALEKGKVGETYNIGGSNERTNLQVVQTICGILDKISPRLDGNSYLKQISFIKDRPGHDRRYAINANKIEQELGWRPLETFETGIRKTVEWYIANSAWTQEVVNFESPQ